MMKLRRLESSSLQKAIPKQQSFSVAMSELHKSPYRPFVLWHFVPGISAHFAPERRRVASTAALRLKECSEWFSGSVKSVQGTGKSGKPLTFKGHFFLGTERWSQPTGFAFTIRVATARQHLPPNHPRVYVPGRGAGLGRDVTCWFEIDWPMQQ